ncbi:LacI family DNA-binding transcriptional regulator [Streptomyces globisporus]|uniref:LacI family DNA-binding transcriptional regulator n=1 Tax=Streptomyces globisporus TaxID=1908 RepID=A0A423UWI4_STRGL|nr:LacI family DNA-binding transcriptional regulator [Streptomyces globisporus]
MTLPAPRTTAAPRLSDIAGQAAVSEATVSRVLNGKQGVADSTRQRVLAALDILGYERPVRLRQRSAGLIGLVTPELTNPIFPAFAQSVEQVLAGHGYTPVLCTQLPGGATEDELVEQLVERGVPFVLINGYNERISAPFVSPDDNAAVRMALQHLADLGHRRIGLAIGPQRYVPSRRKRDGFVEAAVSVLGMDRSEAELLVCSTLFSVEGGQVAAGALLDAGCTGIVCGSDLMALGVVRAARGRGLDVPRDVSVVGFDDSQLIAFTDPPLTTVRQPVQAMAAAAVGALLEEIGGSPVQRTEYVFQPELVVRGSTAAVRA